jgi:organic hydroperoxide reductase OsmC/OhrA
MMADNEKGVPWVASVALHPVIVYGGERVPSAAEAEELHHLAHEQCFIANSIRISVTTG